MRFLVHPRPASTFLALLLALVAGAPAAHAQAPTGAPGQPAEEPSEERAEPQEPAAGEQPAGERVAEVRLAGNRRIEAAALLPLLAQKQGMPLDRALLRDDLRTLWAQRFFADVKVDVSDSPAGPVVTYLVQEKPIVREVRILNFEELEEEELKKEVDVKPFQILDTEAVRRTVKKLESKYADKGFFLAEVNSKVVPTTGDNEVDVVFEVVEHAKVEVRRISFQGNRAISDEELKASLGTQESSFLSFLTSQGTYKEEIFQRDLLVVQSLYYNKGYINVRVGRPAVTLSADKRFIYITIPVEEGDPYDYGELGVSGDLLGADDEVRKLVTIEKGQRFSSQDLQRTMLAVQDFFRDRGYAYVQVAPQTAVDVQAKTVDIRFVVQPGSKVTIERIDIVGNSKTHDLVIRRELRIAEGDIYSGSAIRTSKGRVTALGYFESVDITSRQGSAPDTMVLEVAVKEKATGTFQVGLGVSNNEPILLNANISQNNFLGWGYSVAFMAQFSRLRRIFSLSFTNPYLLDTDFTFAFDVYNTLQVYRTFDRSAFGGTVTLGYQLFEDFRVFGTLTSQNVDVVPTGAGDETQLKRYFHGGWTNSLKLSFNYDRRDNRLFPTKGYLASGSVEVAPELLPTSVEQNVFQRYVAIARGYVPVKWGIVAKANLTAGYIRSPPGQSVPASERFFEGGINSLRGFNFRSIASTVQSGSGPNAPLQTIDIGGNKEFLSNWELEFPVLDEAGLRGVLFFDAGNVWSEDQPIFEDDDVTQFGLLMSVGLGARWFTPLGPLRFELGFPLTQRPVDDSSRFEFTIGNFF